MTENSETHIEFVATEAGAVTDFGVLSCGASNAQSADKGHYVNVQANLEEPDEWGVYFEIDDQINGGYRKIRRVQLVDSKLTFSVAPGMKWYPNLERITVDLSKIDTADVEALQRALDKCLSQCDLKVEVTIGRDTSQ